MIEVIKLQFYVHADSNKQKAPMQKFSTVIMDPTFIQTAKTGTVVEPNQLISNHH